MQIGVFRPHEAGAMCLGRLRGAGEGAPKLATPKNGAVLGARGVNSICSIFYILIVYLIYEYFITFSYIMLLLEHNLR